MASYTPTETNGKAFLFLGYGSLSIQTTHWRERIDAVRDAIP